MKISAECRALLEPIASVGSGMVVDRRSGEVLGAYARSTASSAVARAAQDALDWGESTARHLSAIDAWNDDVRVCIEAESVAMFLGRVRASVFLLVAFEPAAPRGLVRLHGERLCRQLRALPGLDSRVATGSEPVATPPVSAPAEPEPHSSLEAVESETPPPNAASRVGPEVAGRPRQHIDAHALEFSSSCLIVTHTEVFDVALQRALGDTVGRTEAAAVETLAWHQASYQLLRALAVAKPDRPAPQRVHDAAEVFSWLGLGVLDFAVQRSGGEATGTGLFQAARNRGNADAPVDAITAGFAAAASEVAFDQPPGAIRVREVECTATGASQCRFVLEGDSKMFGTRGVVPMAAEDALSAASEGQMDAEVRRIADRLATSERSIAPAEGRYDFADGRRVRGLADAESRIVATVVEQLEGDDARIETFGQAVARAFAIDRLLAAARFAETADGIDPKNPDDFVALVVAAARAHGFGSVSIETLESSKRLVLICPGSPLGLYGRLISERALTPRSPDLIGIGMAALVLAANGERQNSSAVNAEWAAASVDRARFEVEQTACFGAGDPHDRVIVTL